MDDMSWEYGHFMNDYNLSDSDVANYNNYVNMVEREGGSKESFWSNLWNGLKVGLSFGGAIASAYDMHKNRQAQKTANELNLANQWAVADYNTPANQVQRLKDANLNPNLVYRSGNVVGNMNNQANINAVDGYGNGQVMLNALGQYMQIRNADADLQAKQLSTGLQRATLNDVISQAHSTAKKVDIDSNIAGTSLAIEKEKLREQRAKSDIAVHDANVIKKSAYSTYRDSGFWSRLDRFWDSLGKISSNIDNLPVESWKNLKKYFGGK